jgi:multidrug transporter EmrE-like cation transporter
MNWITLTIVAINLAFSVVGDVCAKLWGTSNDYRWLVFGISANIITILAWMLIVKRDGLAIPTTIVLVITICLNVGLGFLVFDEKIHLEQWLGIGLGILSILLILDVL